MSRTENNVIHNGWLIPGKCNLITIFPGKENEYFSFVKEWRNGEESDISIVCNGEAVVTLIKTGDNEFVVNICEEHVYIILDSNSGMGEEFREAVTIAFDNITKEAKEKEEALFKI